MAKILPGWVRSNLSTVLAESTVELAVIAGLWEVALECWLATCLDDCSQGLSSATSWFLACLISRIQPLPFNPLKELVKVK